MGFLITAKGSLIIEHIMDQCKKTGRKRQRFAARLKSSKSIICTNVPGPNVILCNAGQATCLTKDIISALISKSNLNIKIPNLVAIKGESYSFLVFAKTEDALLFLEGHNGKSVDNNGSIIYMNFVENVPSNEIICHPDDLPAGLTVLANFITPEEETMFMKLFDWTADISTNNLKNRQVKHYGYKFRYGTNDVDLTNPLIEKIPNECDVLWIRLKEHGFNVTTPDQLTVNKYEPGQGIPSHVDKHSPFGNTILSLSLGSSVVMDWKHQSGKYVPITVPSRSLLIMQGEARYDWQHGIQPRAWDPIIEDKTIDSENNQKVVKVITNKTESRLTRISLTFRWTRTGPCGCDFKMLCDSDGKRTGNIENDFAADLEELYVHQVYEQIAGHFSVTRHKPWPKVVEFMDQVPTGAVVLDLGCGNGKNILKRNDIVQLGCERSKGLLEECKELVEGVGGADCVRLDLLSAGLADNCADVIICIAVLHHMSTRSRRLEAVSTIARLLRPGGRALITVWSKDQSKSNYLAKNKKNASKDNEMHVTVGGLNLPVHENRTPFQHNDLLVPWKLRNVKENKISDQPENTLLRYYHVFEKGELDALCQEVASIIVENSFWEEGNWCVICKKCK